ncbi:MAG: hypothetical protein LBG08_02010 [Spirochaetaceae bacterium]|nr:hypothetical protein [Spirochaetaceae bacterium]
MAVFLCTVALRCLLAWEDAALRVPAGSGVLPPKFISTVWVSLPGGLYIALLLSLSYAFRKRIRALIARLILFVLALLFTLSISLGLSRFPGSSFPEGGQNLSTLGRSGLLLSEADTVMVLLEDPAARDGSRVVSIPGRSLIYQEVPLGPGNTILSLPPVFFSRDNPAFLENLFVDISLAAGQFQTRLGEGLVPFITYTGALIFLLLSLGFMLNLSVWPLANLFLGALAFRGILVLDSFLNSREIQGFIGVYFENRLPGFLISPLAFAGMGVLLTLYNILSFFAWGRRAADEH